MKVSSLKINNTIFLCRGTTDWNGNTLPYEIYLNEDRWKYIIDKCIRMANFSRGRQSIRGSLIVKSPKTASSLISLGKPHIVSEINYLNLQEILFKHFKQRYDILAGEVYGNTKMLSYSIKEENVVNYKDVANWKAGGCGSNLLCDLLSVMMFEGVILPGTYLVNLG